MPQTKPSLEAPARPVDSSPPPCPVCSSAETRFYCHGRDRLFGLAPGRFPLFRCASCRCVFQSPIPDDALLAGFYPEEYWWSEKRSPGGCRALLKRFEGIYREFVVLDHVRFLQRCARASSGRTLLDIGCGSGSFLAAARRRGFEAFGMDRSAHAVAAARRDGAVEARQGDIGSPIWQDRRFDFVTMFHILEHLTDPRAGLRYAAGLLHPGGSLILQVPNIVSYQARAFGVRWYGLDVPRHVINFSPAALNLLLEDAGFRIHDVARFSLRDNPAAIASSLAPRLDPIGRHGRRRTSGALVDAALEIGYFAIVLLSLPPAILESLSGHGGTIWVQARQK